MIKSASGLMTAPGGKQSKQQQDWYKNNSRRSPTKPTTTTTKSNPYARSYNAQSTIQKPRYISDEATQDSINNTMAQGYANADERFQTKSLDRAGLSRGAGQQFMAGQEGVKKMQEAAGAAADVQASDQRTNDQMRSDYQRASEQEAQNNAMIQHQLAQTAWQKQFAQQSLNAQLQMAQEQAMLQLRLALFR